MTLQVLGQARDLMKAHSLLSEEQLVRIFGSSAVSLEHKAKYFGDLWDSWEEHQVVLPQQAIENYSRYKLELEYLDTKAVMKDFTDKHGLEEMIDYQIKGNVIRFADSQYAFLMRLSV
jgi:hypothetical protein